ncbi:MAG: cache domain-containing protein, partial [Chromatiales bacterium]|nr:cache domain-containing protein [Chromatiales bacterium]
TFSITQYYSYVATEKVLIQHAHEMMNSAARDTIDRSIKFLEPAQAAASLTQHLANHNIVSDEKPEILEKYFYEQLKQNSSFSGIYYGSADGGFIYVTHDDAVQKNGYRTKFIKIVGQGNETTYIWRDHAFNILKTQVDKDDAYDPRKRPWYKKAIKYNELIWTDPYIFYSSKQPGITTASPVYENNDMQAATGVIGVDIGISAISDFLANLKIGNSGSAFIVNQNLDIVAYPDLEKIKRSDGDGQLQFTHINKIDDRVAQESYQMLKRRGFALDIKQSVTLEFEAEGTEYQGIFMPFNDKKWPWVVALYVPTDDYIGKFRNTHNNNLYISAIIALIASLIGYYIALRIIRPIRELGEMAHQLMIGDYSEIGEIDTNFREIKITTIAFAKLVLSLREKDEKNTVLTSNLRQANLATIVRLSDAAEFKDKDTSEHVLRVSSVAVAIAKELNLDDEFCENLRYAAPMHDIGKMGIPDSILMKPGRLDNEEWEIIKTHPQIGANILRNPETDMLEMARIIALTHHEKWNGHGYPKGLKGNEIPIEGRICAIADVVDALISRRCYKEPVDISDVFQIIQEESGEHFDPACVDAFFRAEKWVKEIYSKIHFHN